MRAWGEETSFVLDGLHYKHCVDSDIKVWISKALSRYKKNPFRMETRYSHTLVLLPRLSPIGKIVHLIGDNFKPFFLTNWETFSRVKQPNFGGN